MYSSPEVKAPAAAGEPPEEETESKEPESVDEESVEDQTVLVSNKVLMGPDGTAPKEGDEIVVKVVKNYGDESEIVYAPASSAASTETDNSDAEIMALDTERA